MSLRIGPQLTLRLTTEQSERIDTMAFLSECSRQEVVRRLIDEVDDPMVLAVEEELRKYRDRFALRDTETAQ